MPFSLRQLGPDDKVSHHRTLQVLHQLYPIALLAQILSKAKAWEQRERRLNMLEICYLIIAQHLFPRLNQRGILRELAAGLRGIWPGKMDHPPCKSAISTRRKQLPVLVLRQLFQRVCRPMATPQTKGAFALGLRLMAIDSTLDNVIETPANLKHFGRTSPKAAGASPFPQVRCCYLAECGTHAIVASQMGPSHYSEEAMAIGLLSSITAGMLVLMDRGLFSFWWAAQVLQREAHLLARLTSKMLVHPIKYLPDGTYLVEADRAHRALLQKPLTLRVIEYRLCDPKVGKPGELIRLVTTLLDHEQAPALEVIRLYHERWEIESCLDEQKNHLRLASHPLRAQTPQGVFQELYGILLLHYAIRHLMHESALEADLDPDRLSFSLAVEVVARFARDFVLWSPQHHRTLSAQLREEVRSELLPPRRLRFQTRAVKRRESRYQRKRKDFLSYELDASSFLDIVVLHHPLLI